MVGKGEANRKTTLLFTTWSSVILPVTVLSVSDKPKTYSLLKNLQKRYLPYQYLKFEILEHYVRVLYMFAPTCTKIVIFKNYVQLTYCKNMTD